MALIPSSHLLVIAVLSLTLHLQALYGERSNVIQDFITEQPLQTPSGSAFLVVHVSLCIAGTAVTRAFNPASC